MKTEERHKCVVIPIVHSEGPIKILTVRDKRFKEWTFITGGCRKREIPDPLKCAMRELDEETRGTFAITTEIYKYFKFKKAGVNSKFSADGCLRPALRFQPWITRSTTFGYWAAKIAQSLTLPDLEALRTHLAESVLCLIELGTLFD